MWGLLGPLAAVGPVPGRNVVLNCAFFILVWCSVRRASPSTCCESCGGDAAAAEQLTQFMHPAAHHRSIDWKKSKLATMRAAATGEEKDRWQQQQPLLRPLMM